MSAVEATRKGLETGRRGAHDGERGSKNHRLSWRSSPRTRFWANRTRGRAREASFRPARTRGLGGATVRDAQADVPSAEWLRAQLAFKNSMIRGILQFTPSIAFRYVLHRCESLDIRCRESFWTVRKTPTPGAHRVRGLRRGSLGSISLARSAPGFGLRAGGPRPRGGRGGDERPPPPVGCHRFAGRSAVQVSTMILPQVHLRKPCYDFSFL